MIGKRRMRMLNTGLLAMKDAVRGAENFGKYYMAAGGAMLTAEAITIRSLHSLDWLPWPERDCIIFAESPQLHEGREMLNVLCYSSQDSCANPAAYHVKLLVVVAGTKGRIRATAPLDLSIYRADEGVMGSPGTQAGRKALTSITRASMSDEYRQFHADTLPIDIANGVWLGQAGGDDPGTEPALWILAALSHIAMPCYYRVRAKPISVFGPGYVRDALRERPIICFVPFDRLYASVPPSDNGNGQALGPHERSGHIRHLWKRAGLNRFELPREPWERIKLVVRHKVERVYVHPTWVGKRKYGDDAADYEIEGGESPLPDLGSPHDDT